MDLKHLGLLAMRLSFAGTLAFKHGFSKLINFSNMMHTFPDPLHIGSTFSLILCISAEFFCAVAVVIGLFSRIACIPIIINMSVAFFIIHGNDPFSKKELALLYLFAFACMFIAGPGRYSLDKLLRNVE